MEIDRSRKWEKGKKSHPDGEKQIKAEQKKTAYAIHNGRNFSNFVEQLFWPQTEVLKYLKSRSRSISIHTTDDQILKKVDFKVIYEME